MAEFRNIHTRIWKDEWFSDLEVDEKLLFIYLFSNERASVCGMFELPLKFIAFETGITLPRIKQIFQKFEKEKKAYYRAGVVWVVNLNKYNDSGNSPKVESRFRKDLDLIPDGELKQMAFRHYGIPYTYPIDTLSKISADTETDTDTDTNTIGAGAPPKPREKAKHEPTAREKQRAELQKHFMMATHLPAPKTGTPSQLREAQRLWWSPLDEIAELGGTTIEGGNILIDECVRRLRADQLTISDPNSILKTARSYYAEINSPPQTAVASEVY